jgi:hypothetical protein
VLASADDLPFLAWSQRPDTLPTQMSPKASAIFVVSVVVSLPFKLIFLVLVDGWSLFAGSLVQSYGG